MRTQTGRVRRLSIGGLTVGSVLIALAMIVGGPLAEWVFVLLSLLFPSLLILLGAPGAGPSRRGVVWTAIALALLLESTAVAVLLLQLAGDDSRLLGLPTATTVLFAGLGLAPLILVPLAYVALSGDSADERAGQDG